MLLRQQQETQGKNIQGRWEAIFIKWNTINLQGKKNHNQFSDFNHKKESKFRQENKIFLWQSYQCKTKSHLTKSRHDSTTITVCWCQKEIEANMFCLLLEINQLFETKLLQKCWTAVLYFAKSLLFNFDIFSTLLHSVILQNSRGWCTPLV